MQNMHIVQRQTSHVICMLKRQICVYRRKEEEPGSLNGSGELHRLLHLEFIIIKSGYRLH